MMPRILAITIALLLGITAAFALPFGHGGGAPAAPATSFTTFQVLSTTTGAKDFQVGIGFAKGAATPGFITTDASNNAQVNCIALWSDSTCRFAIINGAQNVTANVPQTVNVKPGIPPGFTNKTCADIASASPTAQVAFTGGVSGTVTLTSQLASSKLTWTTGPWEINCIYWTTIAYSGSQLRVAFDVRLYASGNICTRVLVDNGGWPDLSQADVTTAPTVTINGTVVYNPGSRVLYAWAGFSARNCQTAEALTTPDPITLMATRLMPNVNTTFPPSAGALNALPQNYTPYSQAYYHDNMESTGGTPYIGWTAGGPDNLYLNSGGDSRARSSIETVALALQTYPHRCYDHANGDIVVLPSQNPTSHCGGTGGWGTPYPSSSQIGNEGTNIAWDQAHHPSSAYAWLLLSGEYAAYEELETTALASGFFACCGHAGDFPTRDWTSYQTRGQAWATRDVTQFLALSPSNQMKTDLTTQINFALAQYIGGIGANPLSVFFSHEVAAKDYDAGGGAPWQQDFWTSALEAAIDLDVLSGTGATNLSNLAAAASGFSIGRANGNGTGSGGCYSQSASYNGIYANSQTSLLTAPPYKSSFNAYWLATAPIYVAGVPCTNTLNGGNIGDPESYWAVEWDAVNRGFDHGRANASTVLGLWAGASCYARGSCGTSTVQDSVTGNEIPFGYTHR